MSPIFQCHDSAFAFSLLVTYVHSCLYPKLVISTSTTCFTLTFKGANWFFTCIQPSQIKVTLNLIQDLISYLERKWVIQLPSGGDLKILMDFRELAKCLKVTKIKKAHATSGSIPSLMTRSKHSLGTTSNCSVANLGDSSPMENQPTNLLFSQFCTFTGCLPSSLHSHEMGFSNRDVIWKTTVRGDPSLGRMASPRREECFICGCF